MPRKRHTAEQIISKPQQAKPRNVSRTIIGKSRPTSTAGQTRSAGIAFDCRRSRWPSPYPPSLCSVCCLSNNSRSCRSTIRPAAGAPTSGRTTAARSSIARRMRDGRTRRSSAGFPFTRLDGPAKPAAFSSFTLQTRCLGRAARVVADLPDGRGLGNGLGSLATEPCGGEADDKPGHGALGDKPERGRQDGRDVLQDHQVRTDLAGLLADPQPGRERGGQIHRRVLQSDPPPLDARLAERRAVESMRWWLVSTENPCTSRSVKHRNSNSSRPCSINRRR